MKMKEDTSPPKNYKKKIINPTGSHPLSETFTQTQVDKRIAFYKELNDKRKILKHTSSDKPAVSKRFALLGHKDATTVRVYMRATVSAIATELFFSDYSITVENVNHTKGEEIDKDHGHVVLSVNATKAEVDALLLYIKPGASFNVYDGEESKYVSGSTDDSEFIITKTNDPQQPKKYWRRNQSFIAQVKELTS